MRCDHETMETPVACTLGSEEARHRVEEWRRFFERSIDAAERVGPERLRVRLNPLPETLITAVDLALREKSCCNFFDFSIDLQLDGCWLVIARAPGRGRRPRGLLAARSLPACWQKDRGS